MAERHRQEAADVTLLLRLTPAQQTAFAALADDGREGGRRDWKDHAAEASPLDTTAQMLDHMQARMSEHEAHAKARLDALRSFYAALSPEQKPLFDALMRLRHGGMQGGMHGHMHGRFGHGPGGEAGETVGPPPPGA